jgi:hypothetical protein
VFQKVTDEHLILALALKENAKSERVEEAPSQGVDEVEAEHNLV